MAVIEHVAPERRAPSVPLFEPRELVLELAAIRRETAEISSFDFQPVGLGGPLRFHPGQALTLQLQVEGGTAYRTFTIASSPTRPECVTLTVKAAATGRVTRWMHSALVPGMRIAARGPVGRFSVVWHHARKLLLISAGSGATPMMSMLRWLADRREDTDVAYVHVARTPENLLFRAELEVLQRDMINLRVSHVVTAPPAADAWSGPSGRLTGPMLAAIVPDASTRETFCCGPAAFMTAVESIYRAEGGDALRFHTETFGAGASDIAEPEAIAGPVAGDAPQTQS
jgi:ferredoxin-NADP reductase